jgi:hypothetical protein
MQALWSRAARNQVTCRCIQCAPKTAALARGAGAVSIKGPWAFGTPTSTFFYTAIFAAGLAVDGKAKLNRNRAWETAFASLLEAAPAADDVEAEKELEKHQSGRSDPLEAEIQAIELPDVIPTDEESLSFLREFVPLEQVWPDKIDWDYLHRVSSNELVEEDVSREPLEGDEVGLFTEDRWDLLSVDTRFPGVLPLLWPANTGRELVRHHLPPQSWWSYDHVRKKALQKRHTWKKLAIQEVSMGMLAMSLLGPARGLSLPEDYRAQLAPALRDHLQRGDLEISSLRQDLADQLFHIERLPAEKEDAFTIRRLVHSRVTAAKPHYSQDNDGDFYHVCQKMNAAIKQTFSKVNKTSSETEIAMGLGLIAHNIFVSSAPPDVQTFNILITGLKRWNLPRLLDEVILALDKCKIRPNELTCAQIIDHYVRSDQPYKFVKFVERMRGIGDALMLARPDININETGADRLVRASGSKVYQKVYPTPMVFNALVLGVLRFAGLERALQIYYDMKSDGWGLDVLGLTQLLVDCVRRADWDNGLYIWEEINSIKSQANLSHMAKAYANMLSLCTITGNTPAFNHLLGEVTKWKKQVATWHNFNLNLSDVINSAAKLTATVRGEQEEAGRSGQPVPEAPAFAADNLLIAQAVSEYMKSDGPAPFDSAAPAVPKKVVQKRKANIPSSWMEPEPKAEVKLSPEEAWAAWLEHELGEKPAKPAEKPFVGGQNRGGYVGYKFRSWLGLTGEEQREQDERAKARELAEKKK